MAVTNNTKPLQPQPVSGVWNDAALTAIYNLTPLHFGVGQAAAAVDLPIAREAGTGFPLLPATGLKGVARDYLSQYVDGDGNNTGLTQQDLDTLFGPEIGNGDSEKSLEAGALTFGEGRLVAYPVRSLNQPFLHVTCPLIIERLARDLRAVGVATDLVPAGWQPKIQPGQALVASKDLAGAALVLEDLCYLNTETAYSEPLNQFAQNLARLLPSEETATRERLQQGLTLITDADFNDLMARVVPVRARIKLTAGKTTDEWRDPVTGATESGNLWYEEHLPPDCLFLALVGERRQRRRAPKHGDDKKTVRALELLRKQGHALNTVQIGGNETVGYGLCWWSGWEQGRKA